MYQNPPKRARPVDGFEDLKDPQRGKDRVMMLERRPSWVSGRRRGGCHKGCCTDRHDIHSDW